MDPTNDQLLSIQSSSKYSSFPRCGISLVCFTRISSFPAQLWHCGWASVGPGCKEIWCQVRVGRPGWGTFRSQNQQGVFAIRLEAIAIRREIIASRLEVIAIRLEVIATKGEVIASRLEVIAIRLEAIAISGEVMASRLEAIAIRGEVMASRLEAIAIRSWPVGWRPGGGHG